MAKSSSNLIMAGLAGLAAGLAVGVFNAPQKGSKTRKRLKKKFRKMEEMLQKGELSDKFNNLKSFFTKEKESTGDQETSAQTKSQP
jgi:gas vesicle protein